MPAELSPPLAGAAQHDVRTQMTLMLRLRAHEYSGREKGLMVIGSAAALQALAREINDRAQQASPPENADWASLIATAELGTETQPFKLSFHLDTPRGEPRTNIPRSARAFWLLILMLPFALVGFGSILTWAASGF